MASIPGNLGTLAEGTSWVSVDVTASDHAIALSGSGSGFSGLAGCQVIPLPEPGGVSALASGLALVAWLARRRRPALPLC